jgi:hypothetical protein
LESLSFWQFGCRSGAQKSPRVYDTLRFFRPVVNYSGGTLKLVEIFNKQWNCHHVDRYKACSLQSQSF